MWKTSLGIDRLNNYSKISELMNDEIIVHLTDKTLLYIFIFISLCILKAIKMLENSVFHIIFTPLYYILYYILVTAI